MTLTAKTPANLGMNLLQSIALHHELARHDNPNRDTPEVPEELGSLDQLLYFHPFTSKKSLTVHPILAPKQDQEIEETDLSSPEPTPSPKKTQTPEAIKTLNRAISIKKTISEELAALEEDPELIVSALDYTIELLKCLKIIDQSIQDEDMEEENQTEFFMKVSSIVDELQDFFENISLFFDSAEELSEEMDVFFLEDSSVRLKTIDELLAHLSDVKYLFNLKNQAFVWRVTTLQPALRVTKAEVSPREVSSTIEEILYDLDGYNNDIIQWLESFDPFQIELESSDAYSESLSSLRTYVKEGLLHISQIIGLIAALNSQSAKEKIPSEGTLNSIHFFLHDILANHIMQSVVQLLRFDLATIFKDKREISHIIKTVKEIETNLLSIENLDTAFVPKNKNETEWINEVRMLFIAPILYQFKDISKHSNWSPKLWQSFNDAALISGQQFLINLQALQFHEMDLEDLTIHLENLNNTLSKLPRSLDLFFEHGYIDLSEFLSEDFSFEHREAITNSLLTFVSDSILPIIFNAIEITHQHFMAMEIETKTTENMDLAYSFGKQIMALVQNLRTIKSVFLKHEYEEGFEYWEMEFSQFLNDISEKYKEDF